MINRDTPSFTPQEFRTSSRSTESGNACVAIARRAEHVQVRDTKTHFGTPADSRLSFSAIQFTHFLSR